MHKLYCLKAIGGQMVGSPGDPILRAPAVLIKAVKKRKEKKTFLPHTQLVSGVWCIWRHNEGALWEKRSVKTSISWASNTESMCQTPGRSQCGDDRACLSSHDLQLFGFSSEHFPSNILRQVEIYPVDWTKLSQIQVCAFLCQYSLVIAGFSAE